MRTPDKKKLRMLPIGGIFTTACYIKGWWSIGIME